MATIGTVTPDNLIAGDFPRITAWAVIASGAGVLARGTVLGQITASGKCVAVLSTLQNGAQTPYAVLAEDADATSADTQAPIYLTGEFDQNQLVFGGSDTIATHRKAMRALSMFAKPALTE